MKRGQIEIMGFVVIVLLLFFGLLLYFQLSGKDGSNFILEAEQNLEVSNMLSTIKLYTVSDGVQMKDVMGDCIEGNTPSCDTVRSEVPRLIELYGWQEEEYTFYIGEELYSKSECSGNTFVDDFSIKGEMVRLIYCY
jgi:hypothetical protein